MPCRVYRTGNKFLGMFKTDFSFIKKFDRVVYEKVFFFLLIIDCGSWCSDWEGGQFDQGCKGKGAITARKKDTVYGKAFKEVIFQ